MITQNHEVEFKTLVSKKQLKNLMKLFPKTKFIRQINYYYSSEGITNNSFRIREKDGTYLFTYKSGKGNDHIEFEMYIPSIEFWKDREVITILSEYGFNDSFVFLGKMKTLRAEIILLDEASLCFDMNYYDNKKDFEIEYEVLGNLGSLDRFIEILSLANIRYVPSVKSKVARALSHRK